MKLKQSELQNQRCYDLKDEINILTKYTVKNIITVYKI